MSNQAGVIEKPIPDSTANEFEFLRGLPFGPYLPVDSPLHRLDPRTRIVLVVLFVVLLTATNHLVGLFLALSVALIGWRVGRVPFEPLWRGWRSVLPFLLILAVLQVLFRVGPDPQVLFKVWGLAISFEDLSAGLAILLRFSGFIAVLGLAAASISEAELTRGLEALLHPFSRVGLPIQDFVMAVQVTLRYFPLLAQTAERISKAQASRGADWQPAGLNPFKRARQIIPLLVPLFVSSLRRAENMALAMDARGYGGLKQRTSMVVLHFKRQDIVVMAAAFIMTALLIIL